MDNAEANARIFELGRCGVEIGTSTPELCAELPIFLCKIRHRKRTAAGVIVGKGQVGDWCSGYDRIGHKFYRLGKVVGIDALRRAVGGLGLCQT